MSKEEIIKQNKRSMEIVKRKHKERLQEININLHELNSDRAILKKEIQIIILEKEIRKLEAEKRELERFLASQ